jgi:hypothetical protein
MFPTVGLSIKCARDGRKQSGAFEYAASHPCRSDLCLDDSFFDKCSKAAKKTRKLSIIFSPRDNSILIGVANDSEAQVLILNSLEAAAARLINCVKVRVVHFLSSTLHCVGSIYVWWLIWYDDLCSPFSSFRPQRQPSEDLLQVASIHIFLQGWPSLIASSTSSEAVSRMVLSPSFPLVLLQMRLWCHRHQHLRRLAAAMSFLSPAGEMKQRHTLR